MNSGSLYSQRFPAESCAKDIYKKYGALISGYDESGIDEFVDERMAWDEIYG